MGIQSLAQGRLAIATIDGQTPVNVLLDPTDPESLPPNLPFDIEMFREQLDDAVENVVLAPAKITLKGSATLSNRKKTSVDARLVPPPPMWTVPLPFSLSSRYAEQGPEGPEGPQGEPCLDGPEGSRGPRRSRRPRRPRGSTGRARFGWP